MNFFSILYKSKLTKKSFLILLSQELMGKSIKPMS